MKVAGHCVVTGFDQCGRLALAARSGHGAAGVEVTTARWIQRRRYLATNGLKLLASRMQLGDLGQQSLRIGMLRRFKQGFGGRGFDHSAQIHDHDTVGQMLNHSQVMADEQVGQMQLFAQLVKQVDDLSLDGHIQCRHALITDQEIRFNRQGPGDADAGAARQKIGVGSG